MTSVAYVTKKLKDCTRKLETGDITREEADEIYYDFLKDPRSVQKRVLRRLYAAGTNR